MLVLDIEFLKINHFRPRTHLTDSLSVVTNLSILVSCLPAPCSKINQRGCLGHTLMLLPPSRAESCRLVLLQRRCISFQVLRVGELPFVHSKMSLLKSSGLGLNSRPSATLPGRSICSSALASLPPSPAPRRSTSQIAILWRIARFLAVRYRDLLKVV